MILAKKQFSMEQKFVLRLTAISICCLVLINAVKAQTLGPDSLTRDIISPKPAKIPRINGPKVFGVRPNHPIVFTIPVSGDRPIKYSVKNLPKGVKFDEKKGRVYGSVSIPGTYTLALTAENKLGKASRDLKLIIGEEIALTPPMGWNSWNVYGNKVTQETVLANVRAMESSGLINHGWSYMNIDDAWQGKRGGEFNAIQPDPVTFPNIQGLINEAHDLGLKIGIYSSPWIETYAKRIGGSAMNAEGLFKPTKEKVPHREKKVPYAIGQYVFVDNDVKQWAKWGFDYLKYDWNPIEYPETKLMYDALRNSGRDIVFSLSNSTPFASIGELSKVSNTWRTGGDIRDEWKSLKSRLFTQDKWAPFARPGHWNDPDMMILGWLGWGKGLRPSRLTADEQYTHMSAWCLMSVPLLLGNDLTKLDEFTLSLLTNDEVIEINQDPSGRQATVVSRQGESGVMAKTLEDGTKAAGLFNPGDAGTQKVTLKWSDLGITGKYIVRDLWRQKDLGTFEDEFSVDVKQHGVVIVRLRPVE